MRALRDSGSFCDRRSANCLRRSDETYSFVTDGEKEYEFVVQWGEATDTADTEGNVCETSNKIPSREEIEAVIPSFVGEIEQVPPAYSAIKINGRRAYDLVRKGEAVEMPARRIHIYDLKFLEEIAGGKARFCVRCSKGTYIRALGQDLALALGTVGHLCELRRRSLWYFRP